MPEQIMGRPSPPPYKSVTVSRVDDIVTGQPRWHIDRADPVAYILPELLTQAMEGEFPFMEVDGEQLERIIVTDDYGQRFIYVLGEYEPIYDAFRMEWPD